MQAVSEAELAEFCRLEPEWGLRGGKLVRRWTFPDFVQAMSFVNRVAALAEAEGHHPDIDIRYDQVDLGLITHDAGGITGRDLALAGRLNAL